MVIMSTISLFLALDACDWIVETGPHNLIGFIIDVAVILVAAVGIVAIQL